MSQPPQGPIPVTSTNLIPPRVLATRKASVANGQATRRQSSSLDASEVGTTLRSSYDSAIRQLRSSTLVDPLQRVPTTSQILMRIESCRRQLQTLELLMETDNQRLGAMDDAAKVLLETMRLDHMLEDRCDSVEPQLLSELRSLSHPGELEPRRHRYALYVSKFPRSLLTAEQAIDVNAFSDRVQETQDQLQLLEMLQLHESQSLGSEEERLRSFEPDESASELVTHLTTHHATPITAHCVPVISTSVSVDQPTTLRLRPVWVKYFCVEEAARIQNMDGSDDQKCCALIESLLQQLSNARQQVADAEKQSESLERTLGATRDTVAESEDASRRIHDALLDSTSRCEELETMLVDSQQNERHAALRFHRLALSNLALSESLARQLIANTEEVQRGHAVELQLKDFLVFSSQQRSALERVIHEERNAAQAERDRHTETLLERREMDEYNHDLRDEIAAKTAEIALQKAKIEMYQQTLRVDQERHHKNVHSIEVECTSLRERVVQLEAQLDVYHSTTISKGASFRAVQHQLAWEQGSSLAKQSSSKHFERASSARSSLNASVVQEEPSPRPRAQQPPRPS